MLFLMVGLSWLEEKNKRGFQVKMDVQLFYVAIRILNNRF